MSERVCTMICFLFAHVFCAAQGLAADWPQWRGANRDGVMRGVTAPEQWPERLQELWSVEVGEGVASPVVVGSRVFVFTRLNDQEQLLCLQVSNGEEAHFAGKTDRHQAQREGVRLDRGI